MKLIKLSVRKTCTECNNLILKGEPGYKTKLLYMHFVCGYMKKMKVRSEQAKLNEKGIGNYCRPKWLGDHVMWFSRWHYDQANREVQDSTWLEF